MKYEKWMKQLRGGLKKATDKSLEAIAASKSEVDAAKEAERLLNIKNPRKIGMDDTAF